MREVKLFISCITVPRRLRVKIALKWLYEPNKNSKFTLSTPQTYNLPLLVRNTVRLVPQPTFLIPVPHNDSTFCGMDLVVVCPKPKVTKAFRTKPTHLLAFWYQVCRNLLHRKSKRPSRLVIRKRCDWDRKPLDRFYNLHKQFRHNVYEYWNIGYLPKQSLFLGVFYSKYYQVPDDHSRHYQK